MNPLDLIRNMKPLSGKVSEAWMMVWGFVLGGIGLAIYIGYKTKKFSFPDFAFPVIFAVVIGIVLKQNSVFIGAIVVAAYGYFRATTSNKNLDDALKEDDGDGSRQATT